VKDISEKLTMEEIFGVLASIRTSVKLKSTRRTRTLTIISMLK